MTNLPPIYCITLPQTPSRTKWASEQFKRLQLPAVFFNGIHGNTFGLESRYVYNYEPSPNPHASISSGHIGLILSHYMLWTHLWHAGVEEALILEDDAIFCAHFPSVFEEYYCQLPADWNFCHVGHVGIENKPTVPINDKIIKANFPFGTHAYLVKRDALPVLIETNHLAWGPLDIQIGCRSFNRLNYYSFKDSIINQHTAQGNWAPST